MSCFFDIKKQKPKTNLEMCYPCSVINQCYQSDHWNFRTVMIINVKQNCFKTELLILRKFRKCVLYPEILNKIMFVSWIPAELLFLGKIMLRKLRKLSEFKDNDNTKIIRKYLNNVFFYCNAKRKRPWRFA